MKRRRTMKQLNADRRRCRLYQQLKQDLYALRYRRQDIATAQRTSKTENKLRKERCYRLQFDPSCQRTVFARIKATDKQITRVNAQIARKLSKEKKEVQREITLLEDKLLEMQDGIDVPLGHIDRLTEAINQHGLAMAHMTRCTKLLAAQKKRQWINKRELRAAKVAHAKAEGALSHCCCVLNLVKRDITLGGPRFQQKAIYESPFVDPQSDDETESD
jgi:hypothetical protein